MKTWRWFGVFLAVAALARAQAPEIDLPRPGTITVADVTGEAAMLNGEQKRALRADERVRIGATVTTGRRSMLTLAFSNGASVQLGSDAEIEVEEFGQAPSTNTFKVAELKAEPTLSRTRIKLVRGDLTVTVKKLNVTRGSTFHLVTPAGTVRTGEGGFRTMVRMHDLGLGVATIELVSGAAEFEVAGSSAFAPLPAGAKVAFALEVEKNGVVKVGEMPKAAPKGAAKESAKEKGKEAPKGNK